MPKTYATSKSGGGSGTVTSVSVTTANGVSGSVATATTTPAITLTLGAITPTSVNGYPVNANPAANNIPVLDSNAALPSAALVGYDFLVMQVLT
jgi:hypothetical protein